MFYSNSESAIKSKLSKLKSLFRAKPKPKPKPPILQPRYKIIILMIIDLRYYDPTETLNIQTAKHTNKKYIFSSINHYRLNINLESTQNIELNEPYTDSR